MSWKVPPRSQWVNKPPSLYQRAVEFASRMRPAAASPPAAAAAPAAAPADALAAAGFPTVNAIIQKANAKAASTPWGRNDKVALDKITAASAAAAGAAASAAAAGAAAAAGVGAQALNSRNISKLQKFEGGITGASNKELKAMNSALVHANKMGLKVNAAVARKELQAAAALNAVKGRHNKFQGQVDNYLNAAHDASPEDIEEMQRRLLREAVAEHGGRRRNTRSRSRRSRNKKTRKSRR